MELSQFMYLLLFLIHAAYICLGKLTMRKKSNNATTKLPPGSMGWPLVGETFDYVSKRREGLMYNFLTERWNKYSSSIFRTSLIGEQFVIFCNAEGNKFLFSNEQKLVKVWWPSTLDKIFPKTNNRPSSEHSKTAGKLLRSTLKVDVLREYIGIIDDAMKKHLQTDWNNKQVRVFSMVKRYLFNLNCSIFLGIKDPGTIDKLAKGMESMEEGVHSMPINLPGTALSRAIKAAKVIQKELEATIRRKRIDLSGNNSSSKKDFMTHILLATDENGQFFCEEDIASHLAGILLGSYSTIHSTITSIMKYLAEFPDVYDSVLGEQKAILNAKEPHDILTWEDIRNMKYSWSVACEVLRILPPVLGSFREAITDFTYEGYAIPKGSKIHWILDATHKNPKYFVDPEKFDPSRFQRDSVTPCAYVPFGGGPRMCPGNEYARVVILVFMHNVVTRFRWKQLIPNEKIIHHPTPRPAHGLPVILYPHKI